MGRVIMTGVGVSSASKGSLEQEWNSERDEQGPASPGLELECPDLSNF